MSHDEMIAVITAHRDGKVIEWMLRHAYTQARWQECPADERFNFDVAVYRIKTEPRKPREWWIALGENGVVAGGITYHPGHPINCIHVREVLP